MLLIFNSTYPHYMPGKLSSHLMDSNSSSSVGNFLKHVLERAAKMRHCCCVSTLCDGYVSQSPLSHTAQTTPDTRPSSPVFNTLHRGPASVVVETVPQQPHYLYGLRNSTSNSEWLALLTLLCMFIRTTRGRQEARTIIGKSGGGGVRQFHVVVCFGVCWCFSPYPLRDRRCRVRNICAEHPLPRPHLGLDHHCPKSQSTTTQL